MYNIGLMKRFREMCDQFQIYLWHSEKLKRLKICLKEKAASDKLLLLPPHLFPPKNCCCCKRYLAQNAQWSDPQWLRFTGKGFKNREVGANKIFNLQN